MKLSLSFFSALFLLLMVSCSDPCDDINCGDNGSCDDGTCICVTGYEGASCETKVIDKFVGSWTSDNFQCDGDLIEDINLIFEQGSTVTDLIAYDSEDTDIVLVVTYIGNDITIVEQVIDDTTISGTGSLNSDGTMSLIFQITEDNDTESCFGLFSK